MLKIVYWTVQLLLLLVTLRKGSCTSLLCGRTKTVELGGGAAAGAALALALVRARAPAPADPDANYTASAASATPCKLRLSAPNATAVLVRLIDVKESLFDSDLVGTPVLSALGGAAGVAASGVSASRKWSARFAAPAQDTAAQAASAAPASNKSEPCTLSVYIAEARTPVWRIGLCGAQAAGIAARAGSKLLPPRIKVVWTPPTSPYHHTEKLRLVVTAVNSGAICSNVSQFNCGSLGLCVSSSLVCDGIWNCPGGDDEDAAACERRRDPPLLELLRRLTARNQELLGLEATVAVTEPSVIMKIGETEQKTNALKELTEALKPYGPWGYIMMGVLMSATMIMFVVIWECCCRRSKPSEDVPLDMPVACIDLAPTLSAAATGASREPRPRSATPPAYEPPPTYSSLFPRAFKSSPTAEPHCSHRHPPD